MYFNPHNGSQVGIDYFDILMTRVQSPLILFESYPMAVPNDLLIQASLPLAHEHFSLSASYPKNQVNQPTGQTNKQTNKQTRSRVNKHDYIGIQYKSNIR